MKKGKKKVEVIKKKKKVIYTRKSKFTGKGESIEIQKQSCLYTLRANDPTIDEKDIVFLHDEGYTGANMHRPDMEKLIKMVQNKEVDLVVFYRIDRVSRSVGDFYEFVCLLNHYDVRFISSSEHIDNTTPQGKAMMYITSVFSELERDTIAERIRDNMLGLAKTGRWLGGNTPTGFKSEEMKYTDIEGKVRKLFKLVPIENEANLIKLLFKKFLELKSQTKLETYLLQNDIKTKNGKAFTRWAIKNILTNPVYAVADKDVYYFFKSFDIEIYSEEEKFDGKYGLMVYNKTEHKYQSNRKSKKVEQRDIEDWIIAIGKHKGLISGKDWVEVQKILDNNEDKRYRKASESNALLSGILRCQYCGSFMRPKLKGKTVDNKGRRRFDYLCELKDKSRKVKCQCDNINGLEADDLVMNTIYNLSVSTSKFSKILKKISKGEFQEVNNLELELASLNKQFSNNEKKIQLYLDKIVDIDKKLVPDFEKKILELKEENNNIMNNIAKINAKSEYEITNIDTAKILLDVLNHYNNNFEKLDLNMKRTLIKMLVSSITTDGKDLTINLIGDRQVEDDTIPIPSGENSE